MRGTAPDLEYLAACLHGRRSASAEGERLDALCRIRSLAELTLSVYPETEFHTFVSFQRQLVLDLVRELADFPSYLGRCGNRLLDWMLVRFQVQNLKVLLRACSQRVEVDTVEQHLITLPQALNLDIKALAQAASMQKFVELIPTEPLRKSAQLAIEIHQDYLSPFVVEAALDRGYFQELLERVRPLSRHEKDFVKPLVQQEADLFHLIMVVRGRFYYNLSPDLLVTFHVPHTLVSRAQFESMLVDADLLAAAARVMGRVIEALPPGLNSKLGSTPLIDPGGLEALAWGRFWNLANRAFRRSHMGLAAVVGYAGLRRLEIANLITLSEGIHSLLPPEALRARLVPRTDLALQHV